MARDESAKTRVAKAEHVDTVAAPAPGLLKRPVFGPDVPASIHPNPLSNTAALALLLLDAGVLTEAEWRCSRRKLSAQCQSALTRWISERTNGLRCIQPKFELSIGQIFRDVLTNHPPSFLRVVWFSLDSDQYVVGPQVERLETIKRGFGLAALRALSRYSWLSFPMMLCQHQLAIAQGLFWGGEENIEDYIESMELDPENAEEFRKNSISEADILATTPEWLLKSYLTKTPSPRTLRQIECRSEEPLAVAVAQVLRQLAAAPELPNPHDYLSEDGDFYGFSAFVRWSHDDYTIDLAEHMADDAINAGVGYDICGMHEQSVNDLTEFRSWMSFIDNLMTVTRLVDHLLWLLSGASSEYAIQQKENCQ